MDKINKHLEKQGLIKDTQYDSMKGKPCLTNLIGIFEEGTKCNDEVRAIFYMDFQ